MPAEKSAQSANKSKPAPSAAEGKTATDAKKTKPAPAKAAAKADEPVKKAAEKASAVKTTKAAEAKPAKKEGAKPTAKKSDTAIRPALGGNRGKRYAAATALVEPERRYELPEAVELVKKTSNTKFDATVEVHIRLGVDPRQAEQNIRGTVKLPAGTGKTLSVMAFVPAAQEAEAKKAGADFVSDDATLKKIEGGWTDFDVAIATPDQMAGVAKHAKVLGPRGLMPNPKSGTVSPEISKTIGDVKQGTIEFRVAKDGTLHSGVGKVSFEVDDLVKNIATYYQAVHAAKPSDFKGTYVRTITLASTMGPGIKVDPATARKVG